MKSRLSYKLFGAFSCALMAFSLIALTEQTAKADWLQWTKEVVEDNFNAIRGNTVGRMYDQTFVAALSGDEVKQYKDRWGGDYTAKITDWCNNKAYEVGWRNPAGNTIPFLNTIWREENGVVNCYARHLAQ